MKTKKGDTRIKAGVVFIFTGWQWRKKGWSQNRQEQYRQLVHAWLRREVADLVREQARLEGKNISAMLNGVIVDYLRKKKTKISV